MNNSNARQVVDEKTLFPVDLISITISETYAFDAKGIPYLSDGSYHPALIAQYALACWNDYCRTGSARARKTFLVQVEWFVENEKRIGARASGWPISSPSSRSGNHEVYLSATVQGCALALLERAYRLTHERNLYAILQRTFATFEQDILDGGVYAPVGEGSIFFEERGVYPASHNLNSCLFALFCLYDSKLLIEHTQGLIERGVIALHRLLPEFDAGFWTYSDLLHRRLSTSHELVLHIQLLEALPHCVDCAYCASIVVKWKKYQARPPFRRSVIASWSMYSDTILHSIQAKLFHKDSLSSPLRVCVAVPAFPVLGGVLTVLEGIAQVTRDIWQIEYVTNGVGGQREKYVIHQFGTKRMGYWQFPMVWMYVIAGCGKLLLMHRHSSYHVIFSQDSVFTGALAALAGKLMGTRVVCIDHGHLTLLNSKNYRGERVKMLRNRVWYRRFLSRFLYLFYWPSLSLLAHITGHLTDYFLVPGIAGDGVEEVCTRLGVPVSRLVRFASMISTENHSVLDATTRAELRVSKNLPAHSIIITIICRLAPEKGLEIALESISRALFQIPFSLKERIVVVIAGDGPLRQQLEGDVNRLRLGQTCIFWGDIPQREVASLLAISDIFLYTSIRGACFPMAVLEAMASCCAVIASTQPSSNAHLLAEGRGIAVDAGDVEQTSIALTTLMHNLPLCREMGKLSREYIESYHSPTAFRRTLLRATHWSGLDTLLYPETSH